MTRFSTKLIVPTYLPKISSTIFIIGMEYLWGFGLQNHELLIHQIIEISDHKQRNIKIMITVNEAQQQLPNLIDSVNQSHRPVVISGQNNNTVLLSEMDWRSIQETLYLLSIPEMRESIQEGLNTSIEDCDIA